MRLFIVCMAVILFAFHCAAQVKYPDNFKLSNFTERELPLPKGGAQGIINTANIQVSDWRADTTAIGFERHFYFTVPGICEAIKNNLSQVVHPGKDSNIRTSQVVVCLKKIWITKYLKQVNGAWTGGIIWKINCFKKVKDTFSYLCRLDTTIAKWPEKFKDDAAELLSLCMRASAEKINAALSAPGSTAKFTNLNQYRYNFTTIPVLCDSIKKKGLYMTYQQFLANAPADVQFELEKGKLTDALHVKDAQGKYQLLRDLWGLCDGQNMYIKSGEKYYQLCRVNNTFYTIGSKTVEKHVYQDMGTAGLLNLATNTNRKITTYAISNSPYQLDITNGELY